MAAALLFGLAGGNAVAAPSPFAPDAWSRGNNADISYFGWDVFEIAGPPNYGFLWLLDDSTPDLGSGTSAVGRRIFQGNNGAGNPSPTSHGHVSSSGNYYSFFDTANDTLTATAPAGGAGGYTTVVLQVHSTAGGEALGDLQFDIDDSSVPWLLDKHLHNTDGRGLGFHWLEWTAPGDNLAFRVRITSFAPHRAIDAFEFDTYWSATGPVVNSIASVPEPTTCLLAVAGLASGLVGGRVRANRRALHPGNRRGAIEQGGA
jgi:hypothetical protein